MEIVEEKRKKIPALPETFKEKQRNFTKLHIKHQEKEVCPKDASKGGSLLMKKLSIVTRKVYRTEIQMVRLARKAGNFYLPVEPRLDWSSE